ncbi:MAG: hypothetical protein AAGB26_14495 [Planctomycetota bacterium]
MPPFLIPTTLLKEKFAMKTCKTLLLVPALCMTVDSAHAVPFTDIRNFEEAPAGPFGGGWNISSATQENVIDGSTQSPFDLFGGFPTTDTRGLRLTNATASDTPQKGASLSPNPDVNIPYYFQFDFRSFGDVDNAGMFIGGGSGRAINIHMSSENSTFVSVNQGSGFGNISGMELANDTWYRFTLTIDPSAQPMTPLTCGCSRWRARRLM